MARFNFPSRLPSGGAVGITTFPSNLIAGNRSFYTEMSLTNYIPPSTTRLTSGITRLSEGIASVVAGTFGQSIEDLFNGETLSDVRSSGTDNRITDTTVMRLPIPKKVNENHVLKWHETSITDILSSFVGAGPGSTGSNILGAASAFTGVRVNPFMYLYFDRPTFKQFSFTWTLPARNEEESNTIKDIVLRLKKGSSPSLNGPIMLYPDILDIRFYPDDIFGMLRLKPCLIEAVSVDYTPSGPSFFESGAPTLVNITLSLKEIQLWEKDDRYYDPNYESDFRQNPTGDFF